MENKKIAIIGVGNMGGAIAKGLLKSGSVKSGDIFVSDRKESILEEMRAMSINICQGNSEAVKNADVVIVAVKPYHIENVIDEIKNELTPEKIFISIVAGVGIVRAVFLTLTTFSSGHHFQFLI